jgi:hypothetical protein
VLAATGSDWTRRGYLMISINGVRFNNLIKLVLLADVVGPPGKPLVTRFADEDVLTI